MRVAKLRKAVASVFDTAMDPTRVEVVLRVHSDDKDTIAALPELMRPNLRVAIGPPVAYGTLGKCFDEAAALATGQWHMQFNDDTYLQGEAWDQKLADLPGPFRCMVQPELNQLGPSGYRFDVNCPFMWYPSWVWSEYYKRVLPDPADKAIWSWSDNMALFLSGITVYHDRDEADCHRIAVPK